MQARVKTIRWFFMVLVLFGVSAPWGLCADYPSEAQLKAAYLYRFCEYIEWPDSVPTNQVVIGILEYEPYRNVIEEDFAKLPESSRPVLFVDVDSPADALACHILFLNTSDRDTLTRYVKELGAAPVLVVTDVKSGAKLGAAIHFFSVDEKIRFVINQSAAESVGITIRSRLLHLGRVMNDKDKGVQP